MSKRTEQPELRCSKCGRRLERLGTFGSGWGWKPCPEHPTTSAKERKARPPRIRTYRADRLGTVTIPE